MNPAIFGFLAYLLLMMLVGLLTYRANKSDKDFFLAGRKLGAWVVAFSERASAESAWLLLGLPGAAYASGLLEFWTALGCVLGILLYWTFIAKDLRIESEKVKAITIPNFFAEKFAEGKSHIRILATVIIVFFYVMYLAAQIAGAGKVFFVTFELPQTTGMLIGAGVVIFYTMMGGFLAVAWTDLIQGIIMIGVLVILPVVGFIELSEQNINITESLSSIGGGFTSHVGGKTGWAAIAVIIGGLSWILGFIGQPHLLTRFMSIRDPQKIKIGRRIAIAWSIPAYSGAIIIGLIGMALYGQGAFTDVEEIMPYMATTLLPAWIAGVFICGAIAAMMSTADSQLLVVTSSVMEDFYKKTLGRKIRQKILVNRSRIITTIVGIIALVLALTTERGVFKLVSYAWSGLGASFGPGLLLLLKWKKTTWQGVIAGMYTGFLSTILWSEFKFLDEAISTRFTSFVFAFIAVIIVSLITRKKE
ncbi:sodium/proline symporter [Bacteroidota bacterium]